MSKTQEVWQALVADESKKAERLADLLFRSGQTPSISFIDIREKSASGVRQSLENAGDCGMSSQVAEALLIDFRMAVFAAHAARILTDRTSRTCDLLVDPPAGEA